MNKTAKYIAHKTLFQNRIYSSPNYDELQRIIEAKQFTIILYKKYRNSRYVSELIEKLNIQNKVEQYDSFFYLKNNLKFIFINSEVSNEDKCSLMRHELGHISNPNMKEYDAGYSRIKSEEFANEFSYHLNNPTIKIKLLSFIKPKIVFLFLVVLFFIVLGFITIHSTQNIDTNSLNNISNEISYNTNDTHTSNNLYYITSNGNKYHRDFCIVIKNRINVSECSLSEAIENGYSPCLLCIGENK